VKRTLVALLSLSTLACGGLVESAKQSSSDRLSKEVAERSLEYALGADDIQITEGGAVIRTADGELRTQLGSELPADFPLTLPASLVAMSVTDFTQSDKKMWSIQANVQGDRAVAQASLAALDAEILAKGWTVTTTQDMAVDDGMLSMRAAEKGTESLTVATAGDGTEYVFQLSWIVKSTP